MTSHRIFVLFWTFACGLFAVSPVQYCRTAENAPPMRRETCVRERVVAFPSFEAAPGFGGCRFSLVSESAFGVSRAVDGLQGPMRLNDFMLEGCAPEAHFRAAGRAASLPLFQEFRMPHSKNARTVQGFDIAGRHGMTELIPRLKRIFAKEGVPEKWVWVAEVESSFNAKAKSSAGALGLFQLMPPAAERFGLRTGEMDERIVPEKSAAAAARYLKFLHGEFGCWTLALAAYNAGEGRVRGLMNEHKAGTFQEIADFLPAETQAYVPKVMARAALREDQLSGIEGALWNIK